jgi:threonine/homoserine/homoserine lactone efflux protein
MIALTNFIVSFFFSFIGTIPPGTLNLSILQLGLENKISVAWRFALAAAIMEYPYAWLAVTFEKIITSSPVITENIQLIAAIVMVVLGGYNLWSATRPIGTSNAFSNSGFRRGVVLSILNPLALPFWVGTTAYLNSQRWIDLTTPVGLHSYLLGVTLGTLALFILLIYLAKKIVAEFKQGDALKKIPGIVLIALGVYAFIQYLI